MSIVAQIGHVMAKDIRQARWTLVMYVAVVLVATAHSLVWDPPLSNALDAAFIAVVVLGMVSVASIVQADSPTRQDAYWASQPLAPSAVLGAKLALAALLVVGLAAVGQALGLAAHGVPTSRIPQLLFQSVWEYASWILFAMIVAALTRDVRTFLLVVILVPLALLIIASMTAAQRVQSGMVSPVSDLQRRVVEYVALLGGLVGGLTLLSVLYHTRDSRRYVWALGAVCAACALLLIQGPLVGGPPSVPAAYSGPKATFTVGLDPNAPGVGPRTPLQLTADVPDQNTRLTLIDPVATLYVKEGTPVAVSLMNQGGTLFTGQIALADAIRGTRTSAVAMDSSTRWLSRDTGRPARRQYTVELSTAQMDAISHGVDSISFTAVVSVETPSAVDTMPLVAGATLTGPAWHAKIRSWTRGYGQATLSAVVRSISFGESAMPALVLFAGDRREFALWNPARREAITLMRRSSQGGGGWLVLPGVSVDEQGGNFEPAFAFGPSGPEPRLDDAWFDGARLVLIQWAPRGSYSIRVTTVIPRE